MSKRARKILKGVPGAKPIKFTKPVTRRDVGLAADDVSSITSSECGILNQEYLSKNECKGSEKKATLNPDPVPIEARTKCESWLSQKSYLKEIKEQPKTPIKSQLRIVDYSPSTSTSTRQSEASGCIGGKENASRVRKSSALSFSISSTTGSPHKSCFGKELQPTLVKSSMSLGAVCANPSVSVEQTTSGALGGKVYQNSNNKDAILSSAERSTNRKTNSLMPSAINEQETSLTSAINGAGNNAAEISLLQSGISVDQISSGSNIEIKSPKHTLINKTNNSLTKGDSHESAQTMQNKNVDLISDAKSSKCTPIHKSKTLTLGIRHPNQSSGKQGSVDSGAEKTADVHDNMSPYQRLQLKNIAENNRLLENLLKEKSFSPAVNQFKKTPGKTPNSAAKKRGITLSSPLNSTPRDSLKRSCKGVARSLITNIHNAYSSDEDSESISDVSVESLLATPMEEDILSSDSDELHLSEPASGRRKQREPVQPVDPVAPQAPHPDVLVNPEELVPVAPKRKSSEVKAERKILRNAGQSYVGVTGKVVSARKLVPPHECKVRECHLKITPEISQRVFEEYWKQGDRDKRVSYVAARIEREEVKRKRPRDDLTNREKEQTFKYFLEVSGKRLQICRSTFLNTLGETDRFVRTVAENKGKSETGITIDDCRGHHTPSHAVSPVTLEHVENHIKSYPAYESHYCRAQTKQLYLPSNLTVAKMHSMYLEQEGNPKVSYSTYLKVFQKSGRKFHAPKADGCDKCDKMEIAMKSASEEEKINIKKDKELHLRKAEKAYSLKREAKAAALKDKDKKRVLIFDLQQCLPTPYLQCKQIYYSRQLYVYNFTVYDNVTNLTFCYMWDQVEGKRGSNELASCLLQHILTQIPEGVEDLKMFSDCCSGQNRNHVISMMVFAALQEHPTLKTVTHYFLVPGHTFMPEVDSKHSVIESYKKKHLSRVNVPSEWYQAVENAGKTMACPEGKFKVVHKTDFLDISALAKNELVKRTSCTDKESFSYLSTHVFAYDKKSLGVVSVKSSFNEQAAFRNLSFLRKGVRSDRLPRLMPKLQVLHGSVPISKEKKKDLLNLLEYLEEEHHAFYQSLPSEDDLPDLHPDLMDTTDPDDLNSDSEV